MEKLHGNCLVAAAVFCLVLTFTSAALVSSITCQTGNECDNILHSSCDSSSKKCKCNAAYKDGTGDDDGKCVPKVLGDTCTAGVNAECAGVTNAECRATDNKCACPVQYVTGTNKCTLRGLTETCEKDNECSGVSNAVCAGETGSKKCACKTDYKTENGQCNTANGLQTLLSAPVALLLSFLTIAVTRMH